MRPPAMTRRSLLCSLALLSGCAGAPPETIYLRAQIPEALLSCPSRPEPPVLGATQRDAALFVLDLSAAHAACRARLGHLRGLIGATDAAAD